jgi:hypothetical protein
MSKIDLKFASAASKFSMISSVRTWGSGRLSKLLIELSLSQVISKDVLSLEIISL